MRIGIITPAPPRSLHGNRVTALRWAKMLRSLGHQVVVAQRYAGQPFDILVALHAKRSYASILRFYRLHPNRPLIVALTGTDLYRDLHKSRQAQRSLQLASRIIVLQPKALEELPPKLQKKTRVIYQSVEPRSFELRPQTASHNFLVCVIGHLREVKDPFRAAMAARLLPKNSRIQIVHAGAAHNERMAIGARREMHINPRYRWLGEQSPKRVHQIMASSQLLVHPSRMEGGANVISEAIVAGLPVIASHVPGNIGLLGENYPGYFQAGDKRRLAELLWRAETNPEFLADLKMHCRRLTARFEPLRERQAWANLIAEHYY